MKITGPRGRAAERSVSLSSFEAERRVLVRN